MYKTVHGERGYEHRLCARAPRVRQEGKVGKYSSLIVYYEKNFKYGENKHNRTRSSVFMHKSVTIQGNITAMRNRNAVIQSSTSYPCQSRYDVGT